MARLDDIVEANMLNAEYLQDISNLQKEQFRTEVDTNKRFRDFFRAMQEAEQKRRAEAAERSQEAPTGDSPTPPPGPSGKGAESSFGSSFGKLAGAGIGAGVGMTALGFGIGGFFTGLAAGDKALTWMNTDLNKLVSVMTTLTDGFAQMNTDGLVKLGGVMAAGGVMGTLLGPGKSMKAGFGMFALGAGIGGFFAGLAAGDAAASYLSADGTTLRNIMVNLAEGLGAFAGADLAVLGGLLATGGLLGATGMAGPAATGLGLLGVGIGAFFAGVAGVTDLAGALGADGSGLRDIMVNLGAGLAAISSDEISMSKLLAFGPAAVSVAAGLTALTAGELISGLGNFVSSLFTDENTPSVFERIAGDLKVLSDIDVSNLKGFDQLADSMFRLGDGIDKIASADMDDFQDNIEELGKSVAFAIPIFDKMWNGGKLGEGYFDGYSEVDFGEGLKSSPVPKISAVMTQAAEIPISSAVEQRTMSSVGEKSGNVTVINNTNAPTTTTNNTTTGGGDAPLPQPTQSNGSRADAYAGA